MTLLDERSTNSVEEFLSNYSIQASLPFSWQVNIFIPSLIAPVIGLILGEYISKVVADIEQIPTTSTR